ncbi:phage protein NinX family protein [Cronobacter turicensis]
MDYSKLNDLEINMRVADIAMDGAWHVRPSHSGNITEGWLYGSSDKHTYDLPDYCNNPADAWPIIVKDRIGLNFVNGNWRAQSLKTGWVEFCHGNPLRAAMTVFLMMQES